MLCFLLSSNVLLVVNDSIYPSIKPRVDTFSLDLQSDGYSVHLFLWNKSNSCETLRGFLRSFWQSFGLEGAIFIGDLPVALLYDSYYGKAYPADVFYMDLDGIWIDNNHNGQYDGYEGDRQAEIWVGRIMGHNLTYGGYQEAEIINAYLERNHRYRNGSLSFSDEALLFFDEWQAVSGFIAYQNISSLFWTRELFADSSNTDSAHYTQAITAKNLGWLRIETHSTPLAHEFTTGSGYTYFHSSQIPTLDPQIAFVENSGCSASDFTVDDCLGCWYVFNPEGSGLAGLGVTSAGGCGFDSEAYELLAEYSALGNAFLNWFNRVILGDPQDYYPCVFFGDPTLRLRREIARGEVLFYDQAGDLDLTPDPGETLQVYIKLRNQTENQTISGITATLSVEDSRITILDSTASYGDFSPGEERINPAPFRIAISPSAPRGLRIPIDLRIRSTGGREWLTGFYLNIEKPFIAYFWQRWDDPDGNLDPGETSPLYVQLYYDTLWASWGGRDTGQMHICATGVTGVLRSLDTALTVTDSTASYGIISWGMRAWPTDPFRVRASSGITESPYVALLELEIRTNESPPNKDTFSVTIGDYEFFYDDFEEGAKGWLHEPITPGWHDEWHLEDYRHNSGEWSWNFGLDLGEGYVTEDGGLLAPMVLVDSGWVMTVWCYSDVYTSNFMGVNSVFSGGWAEINRGEMWEEIEPLDGYGYWLYGWFPWECPRPCWGGKDNAGFFVFPLDFHGQALFRFRFASIYAMSGFEGLYIDDFYVGPATGLTEKPGKQPLSLSVSPNPAKGQVRISFTPPEEGPYSLRLYDAAGRMVRDLGQAPKGGQPQGIAPTSFLWVPDVPCGVYFLRLEAGGKALTEKLVIQ